MCSPPLLTSVSRELARHTRPLEPRLRHSPAQTVSSPRGHLAQPHLHSASSPPPLASTTASSPHVFSASPHLLRACLPLPLASASCELALHSLAAAAPPPLTLASNACRLEHALARRTLTSTACSPLPLAGASCQFAHRGAAWASDRHRSRAPLGWAAALDANNGAARRRRKRKNWWPHTIKKNQIKNSIRDYIVVWLVYYINILVTWLGL